MFFGFGLSSLDSREIHCTHGHVTNAQGMGPSLRRNLSFEGERDVFNRDLPFAVVDLDEAFGDIVGSVGVFLEVNFQTASSLVDATTCGQLLRVMQVLSGGHVSRRPSDDDSSLGFNCICSVIGLDLRLDLVGDLELRLLLSAVKD